MRVLVTGGAGFIGSHVVDYMRAAGHEPVIFDVRESPFHAEGSVETIIGDILDPADMARAAEGCDAIAHLAAAADVDQVKKDPAGAEALNSRGTLNVLEAARTAGVDRVVYASTIWVYGAQEADQVDEDATFGLPDHLYTATKLAGEMYCRSYGELDDVDTTILRFGIPYGPRARPAAVIPAFTNKALAGEPLTIAGTGDQCRRFVYVEDLADGVAKALCPGAANRVYNLVGSEDVSIRRIADTVRDVIGDVEIVHTPARAGDFRGVEVSGARAATELGWEPRTDFSEGVRRYIEWHREAAAAAVPEPAAVAERVATPVAAVAPATARTAPRSDAPSWRDRIATAGLFTGAVGLLAAYLLVIHAKAGEDVMRTVLLAVFVASLALSIAGRRPEGRGVAPIRVAWAVAIAGALGLLLPPFRGALDMAYPDLTVILLSLAGVGFGAALVAGSQRLLPSRALKDQPGDSAS
jgi:UDP-glucose 4-epimerase